jgi:alkylhydroperoxidase/carboxymuconolactone decarboxylase family protein YurZ
LEALGHLLPDHEVEQLRRGYDKQAFLGANQQAFATAYPPLGPWAQAVGSLLYADEPIPPRIRELCLITLLTYRAPGLALATHVYWGLMEGVTVEQVCHAASLSGCYGGFPTLVDGIVVIQRTLGLLHKLAAQSPACGSKDVLVALGAEFGSVRV